MARLPKIENLERKVAYGLLNLRRPDLLEDSELTVMLNTSHPRGLLAKGKALASTLDEAGRRVIESLEDVPAHADKRALLMAVILDGKSLSQWAREHNRRRDVVSRGPWKKVTTWVAEEFEHIARFSNTQAS